ncbi:MAG TPA: methyltransferase domain-containing protein, partial [Gammaproteobacteria bacterium]|nr:methyltransferase domain-containing protein [Gammaproteobacteria bacterium]
MLSVILAATWKPATLTDIRLTDYARDFISQGIKSGDTVIDATAGNGHDTLLLAEGVGQSGTVYAFDVQEQAIRTVRLRLDQAGQLQQLKLVHGGHQTMSQHIPRSIHGTITAIMFNLGYLPGADHQLTTQTDTTLRALDLACVLLAPGGKLSIIAYPGHQ